MVEIYLLSFAFLFSCIVTLYAVPSLIKLAYKKRLFDDPALEERKIHKYRTPNLGGIAVLISFAFTACLCIPGNILPYANYIFASGLLIFSVGLKDDLAALNPYKKFLGQAVTALIVVYFADIRLTSFYGVFGIHDIHPVVSYPFTSLLIVFIINAFNLIDGINGLLGSVSMIVSLTFGYIFFQMEEYGLAILAASMAGSVLGFLRYNMGKARIFMGDAGAYTIGFIVSVLAIQFIELNKAGAGPALVDSFSQAIPTVAITIAILVVPIFDTLRVIVIRLSQGKSPFMADRNHLHHRLLDTGMSHTQATLALSAFNILIIGTALTFHFIGTLELLILIGLVALLMNTMLWLYDVRQVIARSQSVVSGDEKMYPLRDHAREVAEEALQQYEEKQHQN